MPAPAEYKIDCIRNNDGTPVISRNPRATLWFVQRLTSPGRPGAIVAQCKTEASARAAMAKRVAKDAGA